MPDTRIMLDTFYVNAREFKDRDDELIYPYFACLDEDGAAEAIVYLAPDVAMILATNIEGRSVGDIHDYHVDNHTPVTEQKLREWRHKNILLPLPLLVTQKDKS